MMGELLGVKTKVINGYQGGLRMSDLAMQRGELEATCGIYIVTLRTRLIDQVQSGNLIVWMTFGSKRDPALPDVPTVYAVVKNDADREVAQLIFGQDVLSRPLTAPPGVSIERTAALRAAFLATMADAAFQDETTKAGLEIHAMDGAETQRRYQAFYDMPKSVVERAKKVIGRDAE